MELKEDDDGTRTSRFCNLRNQLKKESALSENPHLKTFDKGIIKPSVET